MAVKEKEDSSEEFEWTTDNEIQLFFAMNGHKPVGKSSCCGFFDLTEFFLLPKYLGYVFRLEKFFIYITIIFEIALHF